MNSENLLPEDLTPLMSSYLLEGWHRERLSLTAVTVHSVGIVGTLRVDESFSRPDAGFHLTVPLAFVWVAQLAVIFSSWDHGLARKHGEIFLRRIHLDCRRQITDVNEITFSVSYRRKRYLRNDSVYYEGPIDIGDGAFIGSGTFVAPLPPEVHARYSAATPGGLILDSSNKPAR